MPDQPPNIVTIVLDCARAKSVGPTAPVRAARTPNLDRLARSGTTFTNAVAPSNWTVPSHMSIMTGAYPAEHGLRTFRKGKPRLGTMAEWFRTQGFETVLFSEQVHLVAGYGLDAGYQRTFSSADRVNTRTEDRNAARQLLAHSNALYTPTARKVIEAIPEAVLPINAVNYPQERAYKSRVCNDRMLHDFRSWIASRDRTRPFHAFVNFVDAHEPYGPTPDWGALPLTDRWFARTPRYYLLSVPGIQRAVPWREFEGGYLLAIEQADRKVGELLTALAESNSLDGTYVIVTSDHGQSFGEEGHVFHGNGAVDAVTRVPLVVAPPAGVNLPTRISRWTSLCAIPSWCISAGAGGGPYDESGRPKMLFGGFNPEPDAVYCEGSPASDSNRSLRNIGLDRAWNHRLLAAYRADSKYVVDLVSGQIRHWPTHGDVDSNPPEILVGAEAESIRTKVFASYDPRGAQEIAASVAPDIDATVDERLRSWGYD